MIWSSWFVMLSLYGLALTTASAAARDAYVQACGCALTFYPRPRGL